MPDKRQHRGPHPADADLFDSAAQPALRQAVEDFSWLLTRGYSDVSSLKLVGDRFQLTERQRIAVMRSSCSDEARQRRRSHQVAAADVAGQQLEIDGFNLLTTIEAALAGGVILVGRDGCFRDMASMHGSYRRVDETRPAIVMIGEVLSELDAGPCAWFLDRPVSNSGRLSVAIREIAEQRGWPWTTQLVDDADPVLRESPSIVVTADSAILDRCQRWFHLAGEVITRRIPDANLVRMA